MVDGTDPAAPWDPEFEGVLRANLRMLPSSERLAAGASLYELGLDSASTLEIIMAFEERYGVELGEGALSEDIFATAGSLWRALRSATDGSSR